MIEAALLVGAAGDISGLIRLLITVLILGLIFAVVWWIVSKIPIPPPFAWVVQVIFGIIVLIVLLDLLFGGLSL